MITSGAVPAPLQPFTGVSQIHQLTASQDFADPLVGEPTAELDRFTAHAARCAIVGGDAGAMPAAWLLPPGGVALACG